MGPRNIQSGIRRNVKKAGYVGKIERLALKQTYEKYGDEVLGPILYFSLSGLGADDIDGLAHDRVSPFSENASGPWSGVEQVKFPAAELEKLAADCGGWDL